MKSRQGNLFASFSATPQSDEKIAHFYNLYKQNKLSWQPNLSMLTKSHSLYDNGTISIPIKILWSPILMILEILMDMILLGQLEIRLNVGHALL